MNAATEFIPALPELQLVAVDPTKPGLEGKRMSYMQAGRDEDAPVLLLHGIGSNCCGWRYVMHGLQDRYRAIAWNAPGYYLTDNLAAETPLHTQYADALAALMDALHIQRAHIVGSSFGSLIAASFASRHPDRVNRLVLSGSARGQKWLPAEERERRLAMRAASIRDGGMDLAEKRWANLLSSHPSETAALLTRQVLAATHPRGMMQSARTSDTTDVVEFASGIGAKTLLMVGDEDKVNPPAISEAIRAVIPDAELVVLPGVGHLPKLEAPRKTIELLLRHFSA